MSTAHASHDVTGICRSSAGRGWLLHDEENEKKKPALVPPLQHRSFDPNCGYVGPYRGSTNGFCSSNSHRSTARPCCVPSPPRCSCGALMYWSLTILLPRTPYIVACVTMVAYEEHPMTLCLRQLAFFFEASKTTKPMVMACTSGGRVCFFRVAT